MHYFYFQTVCDGLFVLLAYLYGLLVRICTPSCTKYLYSFGCCIVAWIIPIQTLPILVGARLWSDKLSQFRPKPKLVGIVVCCNCSTSHAVGHDVTSWCHFGLGQNWSRVVRGATLYSVPPRYSARLSEESRRPHPLTRSAVGILCTNWSRQLKWRDSSMNKHLAKYFYTTTKNRSIAV